MTEFTRRQALLLTLAAGLPLASRAHAAAQKVTVALDWTVNTNHIGLFVARDKGFYDEAGLTVDILPYGDTGAGTLVANRIADMKVRLETARLLLYKVAWLKQTGQPAIMEAALAKLYLR